MLSAFIRNLKQYLPEWPGRWFSRKPVYVPVLVVVVTVILLVLLDLFEPEPQVVTAEEKIWTVNTTTLDAKARSPQLRLYANVESPFTASLTSLINADVKALLAREGQKVAAGQQPLILDDTDAKIILAQRQADLAEIEAAITLEKNRYQSDLKALKLEKSLVALAETRLAREKKTSQSNLTSKSSLDLQKQTLQQQKLSLQQRLLSISDHPARLAQLQAKLARSQAQLEQAERDVQRANVTAPFAGIILKTRVSPGERVRPGEALIELFAVKHMELRAQLPQKYVDIVKHTLAQGEPVFAELHAGNGLIKLALSRISSAVADSHTGVDAIFELPADNTASLSIGQTVALTLILPPLNNVYRVPVASIYGSSRIYRVVNGRLEAMQVDIAGRQYEGKKQFILVRNKQLHAGDKVITTQLPHVINGLKVEPRDAE